MEAVFGTKNLRNLEQLVKGSTKVEARFEMKVGIKRVLEVSAKCLGIELTRHENEVTLRGRVVSRIIYIDETESFNSEERSDNFTEKLILKGAGVPVSLSPFAAVTESRLVEGGNPNFADVVTSVDISVLGLVSREVRFVSDIRGEVEVMKEVTRISSFGVNISNLFEIEESIDLDKTCTGVLGTDVSAVLRDIVVGDGKVTVKGMASINVIAVKTSEGQSIYNDTIEFDFSKTISNKDIGLDDTITGAISVNDLAVRVETKERVQLIVTAGLCFQGHVVSTQDVEQVLDAFSFTSGLNLVRTAVENVVALPAHNTLLDVEGNLALPEKGAYVARVLSVGDVRVTAVNLVPTSDKVMVEGTLSASIVTECEEKQLQTHRVQIPFSQSLRVDGLGSNHSIQTYVSVINCKVKARRGKELLIDARVGLSLHAYAQDVRELITDITATEPKQPDNSAILIYTVNENETLWEIAKRTSVRREEIIRQNPSAEMGIKAGDKIFIYRQERLDALRA